MKKTAILASLLLVLFIISCGNGRSGRTGTGPVEIRENMFITQINAINLNYRDYLGRTIKLEGMFRHFQWEGNNMYFVARNAPGCCGDDGIIGFEVSWNPYHQGFDDGSEGRTYPNENDWVQAQGVLNYFESLGRPMLFILLDELNILERRGQEFVVR
jgi:uncharacterized membrane protein YcgQ (UPF0703/DUF1980 family)